MLKISQCAVCHAWPAHPVCSDCCAAFVHAPHIPPIPNAAWDACYAAVSYTYPWIDLIGDFKFREYPAWSRFFADLIRQTKGVQNALDNADYCVPIPLSRERLQERGYNQALLLARALNRKKAKSQLLLRVLNTAIQHDLSRNERLKNLENAFMVHPDYLRELKDKSVVLVDDVMTTGSTLHAAANPLRRAGVAHITVVVFAYTHFN